MSIPAILLAAGASRRLGQPKQLVQVDGEALLERTVRVVAESGAGPLFVVLGAHHASIQMAVDLSGVHTVVNESWELGIATSIHAGLEALTVAIPNADAVMLLVCDQPKLSADTLRTLIDRFRQATQPTIVASTYAGIAGIPAIFPSQQFVNLCALQGDCGARHLLCDAPCPLLTVAFPGGEVDIDTSSDVEKLHDSRESEG